MSREARQDYIAMLICVAVLLGLILGLRITKGRDNTVTVKHQVETICRPHSV